MVGTSNLGSWNSHWYHGKPNIPTMGMVCQSHWWWFWSLSLALAHDTYLKPRIWDEYPVVNIQKTMEHHHFYWDNPTQHGHGFNSFFYVYQRVYLDSWDVVEKIALYAWTSGDGDYGIWDPHTWILAGKDPTFQSHFRKWAVKTNIPLSHRTKYGLSRTRSPMG